MDNLISAGTILCLVAFLAFTLGAAAAAKRRSEAGRVRERLARPQLHRTRSLERLHRARAHGKE